ncbi:unnamed protein product [Staurois parvus]|uniref:Uncharacterized protein n=1 Tax=Staurois parvus TaxID=386267 RepID=A0ABN9E3F4_9NEOB|nr:unnamed protein product [Staurois parvus]
MCMWLQVQYVLSGEEEGRENWIKGPFYTMQIINPLGSTGSITSMLYCIYRLI